MCHCDAQIGYIVLTRVWTQTGSQRDQRSRFRGEAVSGVGDVYCRACMQSHVMLVCYACNAGIAQKHDVSCMRGVGESGVLDT